MPRHWERIDSTTQREGWTVRWYLTRWDDVVITGATTPQGLEAVLPRDEITLNEAHQFIPAAVCAQVKAEKFDDCPRMKQFVRHHKAARESWQEYWELHPEMLPPVTAALPE